MADKSFGVRELNLTNTSGTPTVSSPNQLNLSAHTVAISTSVTVGQNLTVSANAGISSLNVTGIGTVLNLNVLGVGTITSPSDANAHSRWKVTNQSASAYRFTGPGQDGSENNPNVYLVRGQRYIFDVNASGHPFQLRVANGGAAYSDGVTNNGAQSGQVIFNVQHDAPAQLYYQCTNHGSMVGNIYIVGGPQVISGVLTATSFSGSGASLTNLNASNIASGTVPTARLGSGTANSSTFLAGDSTFKTVTGTTINNNADNRVITGSGTANTLEGEANLTYNGSSSLLGNLATSSTNNLELFRLENSHSDGKMTVMGFKTAGLGSPQTKIYGGNDNTGANSQQGDSGAGKFKVTITNPSGTHQEVIYAENDANTASKFVRLSTDGNERLRIDSSGRLLINTTSHSNVENGSTNAQYLYQGYKVSSRDSTSNREHLVFYNPNGDVGSINTSGSNTSYTTASDYRLKENETAISDGITRLKTLKPYRFNFKVDKDTTVDGFFAHEVTAVPEAITGTKDEVDSDNKPVYQGIDHSKLVPLLTAALQEAVTKIETLEAKVATLEGS